MSKFQIEKVDHSNFTPNDCCFVTAYYQTSDTLSQTNFIFHENAYLAKNKCTTGIWKPKSIKNN